jgi:hypothetical protein
MKSFPSNLHSFISASCNIPLALVFHQLDLTNAKLLHRLEMNPQFCLIFMLSYYRVLLVRIFLGLCIWLIIGIDSFGFQKL